MMIFDQGDDGQRIDHSSWHEFAVISNSQSDCSVYVELAVGLFRLRRFLRGARTATFSNRSKRSHKICCSLSIDNRDSSRPIHRLGQSHSFKPCLSSTPPSSTRLSRISSPLQPVRPSMLAVKKRKARSVTSPKRSKLKSP